MFSLIKTWTPRNSKKNKKKDIAARERRYGEYCSEGLQTSGRVVCVAFETGR
jgi:hypothetical protein